MRPTMIRRLVVAAAMAALAVPVGVAAATPPVGLTPTLLAKGTFDQRLKVNSSNIKAKFKQPSDFVVVDIAVAPGGTTGWHTHPGPALVVVKEGRFTLYNGDDPHCRPHRYGPGQSFVDEGGDHVHLGRNETDRPVRLVVTFIVPRGANTFIDADDPGTCKF